MLRPHIQSHHFSRHKSCKSHMSKTQTSTKPHPIESLLQIMKALRDPQTGCPWDVKQDFKSIARYTIEEAYEVVDAIELDDMDELRNELGDLLLQVVFHSQMASERDLFNFADVVEAICNKMINRHPHVFGTAQERAKTPQKGFWEDIKARERSQKQSEANTPALLLDSVPTTLPALTRAAKLQSKAARIGFDWPDADGVFDKIHEEIAELQQARAARSPQKVAEELGDLMFTIVNLSRHLDLDPEAVLRSANRKFQSRFNFVEQNLDTSLQDATTEQMEALWLRAKRQQT